MLGGYWVKHWSRFCKTNSLQERLTDYRAHKGPHCRGRRQWIRSHGWKEMKLCPQNAKNRSFKNHTSVTVATTGGAEHSGSRSPQSTSVHTRMFNKPSNGDLETTSSTGKA